MKLLEPEMVPIQFWRRRSHPLTSKGWGEIRKVELARTQSTCEYCGDPGKIIHHEYNYVIQNADADDETSFGSIRRYMSGFAVSCSKCNLVLHFQFASGTARGEFATTHLQRIRGISETEARQLILKCVNVWVDRCKLHPIYGEADRYLLRSDNVYVDTFTGQEVR